MAILGRNSQAQYYQSGGEGLETIKPLSAQYGLMGRPKQSETPEYKSVAENGLQQQTIDVLTMESTLQTDLAGIYNEGEKLVSKYGSMGEALKTEEGQEWVVKSSMVAAKKNLIQSMVATQKSNFSKFEDDTKREDLQSLAFVDNSIILNTGGLGTKVDMLSFFNLENEKGEKINISPDDIMTVGDNAEAQNRHLPMFDKKNGRINIYRSSKPIDNKAAQDWRDNKYGNLGHYEADINRGDTKSAGEYRVVYNTENMTSSNLINLSDLINDRIGSQAGYGFKLPTYGSNTEIFLSDLQEYRDYLKRNGSVPLLEMEPIEKEIEVTDEKGKKSKKKVKVGFTMKPVLDESGKVQLATALNDEAGLSSFIAIREVSQANSAIVDKFVSGIKLGAIAASNKQEKEYALVTEHLKALIGNVPMSREAISTVTPNPLLNSFILNLKNPNIRESINNAGATTSLNKALDNIVSIDGNIQEEWKKLNLATTPEEQREVKKNILGLKKQQRDNFRILKKEFELIPGLYTNPNVFNAVTEYIDSVSRESDKYEQSLYGSSFGASTLYGEYYSYSSDQDFARTNYDKPSAIGDRMLYMGISNTGIDLRYSTTASVVSYQGMWYGFIDPEHRYQGNLASDYENAEDVSAAREDALLKGDSKQLQQSVLRVPLIEISDKRVTVKGNNGKYKKIKIGDIIGDDTPQGIEYKKQIGYIEPGELNQITDMFYYEASEEEKTRLKGSHVWLSVRHKPFHIEANTKRGELKDFLKYNTTR